MADYLLQKLKDMGFKPYEDDTGKNIGGMRVMEYVG